MKISSRNIAICKALGYGTCTLVSAALPITMSGISGVIMFGSLLRVAFASIGNPKEAIKQFYFNSFVALTLSFTSMGIATKYVPYFANKTVINFNIARKILDKKL